MTYVDGIDYSDTIRKTPLEDSRDVIEATEVEKMSDDDSWKSPAMYVVV